MCHSQGFKVFTFVLSILVLLYMMAMIRRAKQCGAHGQSLGKAAETTVRMRRQQSPHNSRAHRNPRRTGSMMSSESGPSLTTEPYTPYPTDSIDQSPNSGLNHDYANGPMSPLPDVDSLHNGCVPSIRVLKRIYCTS